MRRDVTGIVRILSTATIQKHARRQPDTSCEVPEVLGTSALFPIITCLIVYIEVAYTHSSNTTELQGDFYVECSYEAI